MEHNLHKSQSLSKAHAGETQTKSRKVHSEPEAGSQTKKYKPPDNDSRGQSRPTLVPPREHEVQKEPENDHNFAEDPEDDQQDQAGKRKGHKSKKKVFSKRTGLLALFLIITGLGLAANIYAHFFYKNQYDLPPTTWGNEACDDTLTGIIVLTVVTPIGFVILKYRVTNMFIGVIYLFLLVVSMIFPTKGIYGAIFSLAKDKYNTIQNYVRSTDYQNRLHNFWAARQFHEPCCGTMEVDRVEDWAYFLESFDLPASCCNERQKKYAKALKVNKDKGKIDLSGKIGTVNPEVDQDVNHCGRGLARTRTRGVEAGLREERVFGGFYAVLSASEKAELADVFKNGQVFHQPEKCEVKISDVLQKQKTSHPNLVDTYASSAFQQIWKNYYVDSVCNLHDWFANHHPISGEQWQFQDPVNKKWYCVKPGARRFNFQAKVTNNEIADSSSIEHRHKLSTIGIVENRAASMDYCKTVAGKISDIKINGMQFDANNVTSYCEEILPIKGRPHVTTFGRELVRQLDYLTSYLQQVGVGKNNPKEWAIWKIPTRAKAGETYPYKLAANYYKDEHNLKEMSYVTRGIAENTVLSDVIHEKICETIDPSYKDLLRTKLAKDVNKRFRLTKPFTIWVNSEAGLGQWFLHHVKVVMYIVLAVCSTVIFFSGTIGVVFWNYYSRIKAEEYANLALPKEFDVLHLKRDALDDGGNAEFSRARRRLQKRRTLASAAYGLSKRRTMGSAYRRSTAGNLTMARDLKMLRRDRPRKKVAQKVK